MADVVVDVAAADVDECVDSGSGLSTGARQTGMACALCRADIANKMSVAALAVGVTMNDKAGKWRLFKADIVLFSLVISLEAQVMPSIEDSMT